MVRDSRSPSHTRRSEYPDRDARNTRSTREDSRRANDYAERNDRNRRRGEENSMYARREYSERYHDREDDRRDRRLGEQGERRDFESDRRDRDRNRDRNRRGGSSRRSASPRLRGSHSRSRSVRSRSKSPEDKAKPNFNPSGLLAAATKTVQHSDGTKTVLKYHEPPEARKPTVGWRLYVFKGKEQVDLLHIHRQSAYLIGRDRLVADIALEHPSCSKQHAAIQFRQVHEKNEFGDMKPIVKPFVIDLESTNGTMVNDATIPTSRYYELKLGDVIKFGESAREYVLLSEDAT